MSQIVVRKAGDDQTEYQQVVYAEVYAPNRLDAHNEWMTAEEIQLMAWRFLAEGKTNQIDMNHDNNLVRAFVVESFIARDDDSIFIPGSWVVGVFIEDPEVWQMVLNGEINAFSMEAFVRKTKRTIEVNFPSIVSGLTTEDEGHTHTWYVSYSPEGKFLGGNTDVVEGHYHEILAGSSTELTNGHLHRFAVVQSMDMSEALLAAITEE